MKTIDRYIIGKTLWPLAAAVGIALLALLLERLVRLLELVVNEGGPFYLILKMLANLIPHYLGIALPAAFFVGVLLASMRLSSGSEFDAIHAAGVSLHRLLAPIMALAVVLLVASVVIIGFLQPYTRYAYRALVYLVTHAAWDAAIERGAFFTGFENTTVTVDGISDQGTRLTGVFVYKRTGDGTSTTTSAASGQMLRRADDFGLVLSMQRGVRIEAGEVDKRATVTSFDHLELPLNIGSGPEPFRDRGGGASELTLSELWAARDHELPRVELPRIRAELSGRIVRLASLLFLPILALPLGISARRTRRGIGFVAGLATIVLYHHVLQFGQNLAEIQRIPIWLGLWAPFVLLAGISSVGLYIVSTRPGDNPLSSFMEVIQAMADRVRSVVPNRRKLA